MGFGDAILATGHARPLYDKAERIYFGTEKYAEYETDVYANNPHLGTPEQYKVDQANGFKDCAFVENYMGHRPYVAHGGTTHVVWNKEYRAPKGDIYLTPDELRRGKALYGERYILIEPHTKNTVGGNKCWLWDRWQEVADILGRDHELLQNGTPKKKLRGVRFVEMVEFRDALVAVAGAKLVVTTQGGLHVAAAALGVPAVVLWGEYAHPRNLGYEDHVNLYTGGDEPCGRTVECAGCVQAMREITVDMVVDGANRLC